MTPAERQQLKRARRKAGLVLEQEWVPSDKADAVKAAIAEVLAATLTLNPPCGIVPQNAGASA